MTAPHIVDPAGMLAEALSEASADLMRTLLQNVINALLSADADSVIGAEWGRPTPPNPRSEPTTCPRSPPDLDPKVTQRYTTPRDLTGITSPSSVKRALRAVTTAAVAPVL